MLYELVYTISDSIRLIFTYTDSFNKKFWAQLFKTNDVVS